VEECKECGKLIRKRHTKKVCNKVKAKDDIQFIKGFKKKYQDNLI
jgi:hypothetical protein